MNRSSSARPLADVESKGLQQWEAEGGAPLRASSARANDVAVTEAVLLGLLGAALVKEWHHLPMPLRRAVYDRAVAGLPSRGRTILKRQMARYLHDHKDLDLLATSRV